MKKMSWFCFAKTDCNIGFTFSTLPVLESSLKCAFVIESKKGACWWICFTITWSALKAEPASEIYLSIFSPSCDSEYSDFIVL